ncbi:AmmeMemoRadiSam system protein B [Motiliproteus sp. MSK22-1]|uniref:AmmeMemoRadiSam system protein B n=1 Tax=Motiliproteus sp. MSK22-1 TaxID=1897630 RepID=UPI00097563C2|nr:AmmeMemoRadiSam system protein B [Motiliproteus sp. MSK22-1]OMH33598.1 AmmeMemoRadiSam system protein B [Motiliproteus sp. MSK22-1]
MLTSRAPIAGVSKSGSSKSVREPVVAGMFYPADRQILQNEIDIKLAENPAQGTCPKALVVPHAGYIYSGGVAARGYNLLRPYADSINRVILLGPSHHYPFQGLALPGCQYFRTPLGDVPIDLESVSLLKDLPQVQVMPEAHAQEHSLEVQVPFLQRVLDDFALLPLVVGPSRSSQVAEVIQRLWGNKETLIVVSTDLSHFHDYPEAQHLDRSTSDLICALHEPLMGEQACGCYPLNGLLRELKQRKLNIELLDLRNSGDTTGSKSRVVGYGSYAVF